MVQIRYTLERHLEEHCNNDSSVKMLYHAYQFNKRQICEVLESVKLHFPHFSKHGASHSACIVTSIELMLGEKRIKALSASDTFLILLASYLHDIGMYLTNEEIRNVWITEDFYKFLDDFSRADKSAAFVKSFYADKPRFDSLQSLDMLELIEHIRIVNAEYFRRSHGEKGAERIRSNLQELSIFLDAGQFIPKRLIRMLSLICSSHNDEFHDLMERLPHKQSSSLGDIFHPRFIAVMLRLGDLMDMDNNRFDELAVRSAGNGLNKVSRIHYDKHNSVEELLITPELIEVISVSEDINVLLEAKQWMNWLDNEVNHFHDNWHQVVPVGMVGTVPKLVYRVKRRYSELPFEDKDLKLVLSPEKAFDIIIGSHIYTDKFIFLRELVQNAQDALKRQLWRDLSRSAGGASYKPPYQFREDELKAYQVKLTFYDTGKQQNGIEQLKEHIGLKLVHTLLQINEPDSRSVLGNKDDSHHELFVVIEDNGTGISLQDFESRILQVGRKSSKEYAKETDNMPRWLQPTGAFGIGIHSVFQVAEQIVLQTKSETDIEYGREIYIQSGVHGGYVSSDRWDCRSVDGGMPLHRGTRVIVKLHSGQQLLQDSRTPILSFGCFMSESQNYVIQYMESVVRDIIDGIEVDKKNVSSTDLKYWKIPVYFSREWDTKYKSYHRTDNGKYFSNIVGSRDSNGLSESTIIVYDKENHHRLYFTPSSFIVNESADDAVVQIYCKGMRVHDKQLAKNLAGMLFCKDKLRIDFLFSNTREYLHLNRDSFMLDKHDELAAIVNDMLEEAVRHYQAYVTKLSVENEVDFKLYNELNGVLLRIMEEAYVHVVKEQQSAKAHESSMNSLEHYLADFSERIIEQANDIRLLIMDNKDDRLQKIFYILFAKRMHHWMHLMKEQFWDHFQQPYEVQQWLSNYSSQYLKVVNRCTGGELGEDEFRKAYIYSTYGVAGGYSLYYRPLTENSGYARDQQWPDLSIYCSSNNSLKMLLYHMRLGQLPSLSNEYMQTLGVLTDFYAHDEHYGHYSRTEENEVRNPLLFIRPDLWIRRAFFGSEALYYRQMLYFPLDWENDRIISFRPVRQLSVLINQKSIFYSYQAVEQFEVGQNTGIEMLNDAQSYLFSELLQLGYLDVEETGWLPFSYEYHVLPALGGHKDLAVRLDSAFDSEGANQQQELRLIYAKSRFCHIRQGNFIIIPFSRSEMELLIKLIRDLEFQLISVSNKGERTKLRSQVEECLRGEKSTDNVQSWSVYDALAELLRYLNLIYEGETFTNIARFNIKYAISKDESDPVALLNRTKMAMRKWAQDIVIYMCQKLW